MSYTRYGNLYTPGGKLPLIGPWLKRANRVYRIWSEPCNPSPWIMVEAAFIGLPRLLWSLYQPDFIDYKYDQITKGWKGHGRRGKMRIWDISTPEYPGVRGLGEYIFRGAEIAQKAGWYFIVVDSATEFALNWSTLVYQMSECRAPGIAFCNLQGTPLTKVSVDGMPYRYEDFTLTDVQAMAWGPTGVGCNYKEFVASFTFSTSAVDNPPSLQGSTASAQLWDNSHNRPLGSTSVSTDPVSGHMISQQAFKLPITGITPLEIGLRVSPSVGWYKVEAAQLSVSASNINIDIDLNSGVKKITWPTG